MAKNNARSALDDSPLFGPLGSRAIQREFVATDPPGGIRLGDRRKETLPRVGQDNLPQGGACLGRPLSVCVVHCGPAAVLRFGPLAARVARVKHVAQKKRFWTSSGGSKKAR